MKIGILTFHRAYNYGAVLQAYALKKVIETLGADVEIINYKCDQVDLDHHPRYSIKKMGPVRGVIGFYGRFAKSLVFEAFSKRRLDLGKEYTKETIKELEGQFDVFIAGSDQIWSNKFSGFDTTFLLDFVEDRAKKYSYAASFGFSAFPEGTKETYEKYLRTFERLSVREDSAAALLRKECDLRASVHLDPTLILGAERWKAFCQPPQRQNKKYILIYTIQPPVNLISYAKRLAEETGAELLYLSNSYRQHQEIKHIRLVSPEEFVGWFLGAEYVLTNSFHGTAFSIIFGRKLVVEIETQHSLNTRSRDLLQLCGLEDRILPKDDADYAPGAIEWDRVNEKLASLQNDAVQYLEEICRAKGE